MSIRKMNGDPSMWEELYWKDLSEEERKCWTDLGWKEKTWDNEVNIPESVEKDWKDLSEKESAAAKKLGFTEDLWNDYEDT